ncbi:hypothetical protein vseg_014940 [Gypsophila vaccaria]
MSPLIEHLTDDLLREILCRLPCYATAVRCKTVSKRWCSIVSRNSLLVAHAYSIHRDTNNSKKPQSRALLLNLKLSDDYVVTGMFGLRPWSPRILSLQFLPYPATLVATFRDLALCYSIDPFTESMLYYVCNPTTKQWMALPPYQFGQSSSARSFRCDPKPVWAALVCREGNDFRVVAVHDCFPEVRADYGEPFTTVKATVYLSEARQWKNVEIRIQHHPPHNEIQTLFSRDFSRVVCKGMVCLASQSYLGAFNPFDVTDAFCGMALTATSLPIPQKAGASVVSLFENDGKLMAISDRININFRPNVDLLELFSWKLELNIDNDEEQPLRWEPLSTPSGKIRIIGPMIFPFDFCQKPYDVNQVIGVHPKKDHLLYLRNKSCTKMRLVLFDTKSMTLEFLTETPVHCSVLASNRLDMPNWPTPLPYSIANPKNNRKNS